ncbi:MAG: DNA-binding response regulator [Marinilabiliales bacterium]|nr:MAG: DNA-binding response regulator [Marinilabiliales bacterium]
MENNKFKLLLVDDEEDILEFLGYNLKREGFQVITANNGKEGIEKAKKELPHLIVMDVMMPEMDGITAVEEIRKNKSLDETLIVFLTARSEDYSQIAGFEAGADDYISKPIKPKVLISRVNALLRRSLKKDSGKIIKIGNLIINQEKFEVLLNNEKIVLPKKEFKLLKLLASSPSKVFTREEIFVKVWGDDVIVGDRTIDVHVRKIREKIGDDYIKTIKGIGYKLEIG